MKRWIVPAGIAAVACVLAVGAGIYALRLHKSLPKLDHPNIVFVMTDDLDLPAMSQFPDLNALMGDAGMTFQNHFVSLSLCCPSRSTILCGKYAHNTGVFTNYAPDGGYQGFVTNGNEDDTMAVWLKDAGYRTALFGKYLNGFPGKDADGTYIPPGWTDWAVPVKGDPYNEYNYSLNENGKIVKYGHEESDYMTTVLDEKAQNFIVDSSKKSQPFFLYLSTYAPHSPATPASEYDRALKNAKAPESPAFDEADISDKPEWLQPEPLTDQSRRAIEQQYRKRIESMLSVQDMMSDLVSTLKKNGQLENTYIIFTSDNGFHLGDHRLPLGKDTAYDTDLHVPLMVRGPGIPAGSVTNLLTANIDFAPTIAELAGVTPPSDVDGRSLVPLLAGGSPAWRNAVLLEHGAPLDGTSSTSSSLDEPADNEAGGKESRIPAFIGLRTAKYTYVLYGNGEQELYDDVADPYQLENLAKSASQSLMSSLKTWATKLSSCSGDTCRTLENTSAP